MILFITSFALSDTLHFFAKNFPKSNTISVFLRNSERKIDFEGVNSFDAGLVKEIYDDLNPYRYWGIGEHP